MQSSTKTHGMDRLPRGFKECSNNNNNNNNNNHFILLNTYKKKYTAKDKLNLNKQKNYSK